jgi:general stress protein 26
MTAPIVPIFKLAHLVGARGGLTPPWVHQNFMDKRFFRGVMLKGKMEVLDDIEIKKEIWNDGFSIYYKDGMNGGDFIILKFTAENGRYYSNFHSEEFTVE